MLSINKNNAGRKKKEDSSMSKKGCFTDSMHRKIFVFNSKESFTPLKKYFVQPLKSIL